MKCRKLLNELKSPSYQRDAYNDLGHLDNEQTCHYTQSQLDTNYLQYINLIVITNDKIRVLYNAFVCLSLTVYLKCKYPKQHLNYVLNYYITTVTVNLILTVNETRRSLKFGTDLRIKSYLFFSSFCLSFIFVYGM